METAAAVSWQEIERLSGPDGVVPYEILLVLHECIIRIAPASFILEITW
ncbi:MAG: hypothetical protein VYE18_06770 [Pseudomonadota bacterium]|nr:hypothetical protein [Pseudomonadota bacterium]